MYVLNYFTFTPPPHLARIHGNVHYFIYISSYVKKDGKFSGHEKKEREK